MNCETLQEYLDRYGPLVADRARQAFEPLHIPATDAVVALNLKRPMLPAQAHVVTAAVKTLQRQKSVFLCCECGTGKIANGGMYRPCPRGRKTLPRDRHVPAAPGRDLAGRVGAGLPGRRGRRPRLGEVDRVAPLAPRKADATDLAHHGRDAGEERSLLAACRRERQPGRPSLPGLRFAVAGQGQRRGQLPDAEGPGAVAEAVYGGSADSPRQRRWQPRPAAVRRSLVAVHRPSRAVWAPADYIHKHMPGVFDYCVFDEVHEEKSETSARANALGALAASCRKVIAMTGTLIGGKAGHVRSLLFRLSPKSLKAENLAWQDDMEFARRYGRVDTIVTEKISAGSDDNRRSHGKSTTKRQAEQPGIMPTLYGRHLIGNTIFLSLKDVAADLPSYDEHPTLGAHERRPGGTVPGDGREAQGRRGAALAPRQSPTSLGDAACASGLSRLSL